MAWEEAGCGEGEFQLESSRNNSPVKRRREPELWQWQRQWIWEDCLKTWWFEKRNDQSPEPSSAILCHSALCGVIEVG